MKGISRFLPWWVLVVGAVLWMAWGFRVTLLETALESLRTDQARGLLAPLLEELSLATRSQKALAQGWGEGLWRRTTVLVPDGPRLWPMLRPPA